MATATPERVGWWQGGWRTVARKEFADHVQSIRLVIVVLIVGAAMVIAVNATAGAIRDAGDELSGATGLFLAMFSLTREGARLPSFLQLVALLAPLLGIAFGFDAVNGERAGGTLPRLLSQPIHRDDVINGKFAAGVSVIGLVLIALTAFVAAIGLIRIGVTPSLGEVVRLIAYLVVTVVYVGFWLALASLFSVWLRRAATSALAALGTWLLFTLFFGLIVGLAVDAISPVPPDARADEVIRNAELELTVSRISPTVLYEEATTVLLRPQARTVGFLFPQQLDRAIPSELSLTQSILLAWPQLVGLVALTLVLFALAYVAFMRQEVRA